VAKERLDLETEVDRSPIAEDRPDLETEVDKSPVAEDRPILKTEEKRIEAVMEAVSKEVIDDVCGTTEREAESVQMASSGTKPLEVGSEITEAVALKERIVETKRSGLSVDTDIVAVTSVVSPVDKPKGIHLIEDETICAHKYDTEIRLVVSPSRESEDKFGAAAEVDVEEHFASKLGAKQDAASQICVDGSVPTDGAQVTVRDLPVEDLPVVVEVCELIMGKEDEGRVRGREPETFVKEIQESEWDGTPQREEGTGVVRRPVSGAAFWDKNDPRFDDKSITADDISEEMKMAVSEKVAEKHELKEQLSEIATSGIEVEELAPVTTSSIEADELTLGDQLLEIATSGIEVEELTPGDQLLEVATSGIETDELTPGEQLLEIATSGVETDELTPGDQILEIATSGIETDELTPGEQLLEVATSGVETEDLTPRLPTGKAEDHSPQAKSVEVQEEQAIRDTAGKDEASYTVELEKCQEVEGELLIRKSCVSADVTDEHFAIELTEDSRVDEDKKLATGGIALQVLYEGSAAERVADTEAQEKELRLAEVETVEPVRSEASPETRKREEYAAGKSVVDIDKDRLETKHIGFQKGPDIRFDEGVVEYHRERSEAVCETAILEPAPLQEGEPCSVSDLMKLAEPVVEGETAIMEDAGSVKPGEVQVTYKDISVAVDDKFAETKTPQGEGREENVDVGRRDIERGEHIEDAPARGKVGDLENELPVAEAGVRDARTFAEDLFSDEPEKEQESELETALGMPLGGEGQKMHEAEIALPTETRLEMESAEENTFLKYPVDAEYAKLKSSEIFAEEHDDVAVAKGLHDGPYRAQQAVVEVSEAAEQLQSQLEDSFGIAEAFTNKDDAKICTAISTALVSREISPVHEESALSEIEVLVDDTFDTIEFSSREDIVSSTVMTVEKLSVEDEGVMSEQTSANESEEQNRHETGSDRLPSTLPESEMRAAVAVSDRYEETTGYSEHREPDTTGYSERREPDMQKMEDFRITGAEEKSGVQVTEAFKDELIESPAAKAEREEETVDDEADKRLAEDRERLDEGKEKGFRIEQKEETICEVQVSEPQYKDAGQEVAEEAMVDTEPCEPVAEPDDSTDGVICEHYADEVNVSESPLQAKLPSRPRSHDELTILKGEKLMGTEDVSVSSEEFIQAPTREDELPIETAIGESNKTLLGEGSIPNLIEVTLLEAAAEEFAVSKPLTEEEEDITEQEEETGSVDEGVVEGFRREGLEMLETAGSESDYVEIQRHEDKVPSPLSEPEKIAIEIQEPTALITELSVLEAVAEPAAGGTAQSHEDSLAKCIEVVRGDIPDDDKDICITDTAEIPTLEGTPGIDICEEYVEKLSVEDKMRPFTQAAGPSVVKEISMLEEEPMLTEVISEKVEQKVDSVVAVYQLSPVSELSESVQGEEGSVEEMEPESVMATGEHYEISVNQLSLSPEEVTEEREREEQGVREVTEERETEEQGVREVTEERETEEQGVREVTEERETEEQGVREVTEERETEEKGVREVTGGIMERDTLLQEAGEICEMKAKMAEVQDEVIPGSTSIEASDISPGEVGEAVKEVSGDAEEAVEASDVQTGLDGTAECTAQREEPIDDGSAEEQQLHVGGMSEVGGMEPTATETQPEFKDVQETPLNVDMQAAERDVVEVPVSYKEETEETVAPGTPSVTKATDSQIEAVEAVEEGKLQVLDEYVEKFGLIKKTDEETPSTVDIVTESKYIGAKEEEAIPQQLPAKERGAEESVDEEGKEERTTRTVLGHPAEVTESTKDRDIDGTPVKTVGIELDAQGLPCKPTEGISRLGEMIGVESPLEESADMRSEEESPEQSAVEAVCSIEEKQPHFTALKSDTREVTEAVEVDGDMTEKIGSVGSQSEEYSAERHTLKMEVTTSTAIMRETLLEHEDRMFDGSGTGKRTDGLSPASELSPVEMTPSGQEQLVQGQSCEELDAEAEALVCSRETVPEATAIPDSRQTALDDGKSVEQETVPGEDLPQVEAVLESESFEEEQPMRTVAQEGKVCGTRQETEEGQMGKSVNDTATLQISELAQRGTVLAEDDIPSPVTNEVEPEEEYPSLEAELLIAAAEEEARKVSLDENEPQGQENEAIIEGENVPAEGSAEETRQAAYGSMEPVAEGVDRKGSNAEPLPVEIPQPLLLLEHEMQTDGTELSVKRVATDSYAEQSAGEEVPDARAEIAKLPTEEYRAQRPRVQNADHEIPIEEQDVPDNEGVLPDSLNEKKWPETESFVDVREPAAGLEQAVVVEGRQELEAAMPSDIGGAGSASVRTPATMHIAEVTLSGEVGGEERALQLPEAELMQGFSDGIEDANWPVEEEPSELVGKAVIPELVTDALVRGDPEVVTDALVREDTEVVTDASVREDTEVVTDALVQEDTEVVTDALVQEDTEVVTDALVQEDTEVVTDALVREGVFDGYEDEGEHTCTTLESEPGVLKRPADHSGTLPEESAVESSEAFSEGHLTVEKGSAELLVTTGVTEAPAKQIHSQVSESDVADVATTEHAAWSPKKLEREIQSPVEVVDDKLSVVEGSPPISEAAKKDILKDTSTDDNILGMRVSVVHSFTKEEKKAVGRLAADASANEQLPTESVEDTDVGVEEEDEEGSQKVGEIEPLPVQTEKEIKSRVEVAADKEEPVSVLEVKEKEKVEEGAVDEDAKEEPVSVPELKEEKKIEEGGVDEDAKEEPVSVPDLKDKEKVEEGAVDKDAKEELMSVLEVKEEEKVEEGAVDEDGKEEPVSVLEVKEEKKVEEGAVDKDAKEERMSVLEVKEEEKVEEGTVDEDAKEERMSVLEVKVEKKVEEGAVDKDAKDERLSVFEVKE
jgi:hypothetical protein